MEGPFGLVSSRCLPRWPWSVFVVSHMSDASYCGSHISRPQSGEGSTSPGRMDKHSTGEVQRHSNHQRDKSWEVEAQGMCIPPRDVHHSVRNGMIKGHESALRHPHALHRKYEGLHASQRHVENAVDKANEGRNEAGTHKVNPPGGFNRCDQRGRSWKCIHILKQVCQALIRSKDTKEPDNVMSYRDRLQCCHKWSRGHRAFEIFLLKAPDCPDEMKAELNKDAHHHHEAQNAQAGPRYMSAPQQKSSSTPSPPSSQTLGKLGGRPGKAALRSLTPEGVRSRSRSPLRGCPCTEETASNRTCSLPNPPSLSLLASAGPRSCSVLRSGPESQQRQRITPRPRGRSRPASPQVPKGVAPWGARAQQLPPRVQNRYESPVRRSRIIKRPSSSPTPPGFAADDEPELLEPENERLKFRRPCNVRSRPGISPKPSNYRASSRDVRDQSRLRGRPKLSISPIPRSCPGEIYDMPGSPLAFLGSSQSNRAAAKEMTNSMGSDLALQLGTYPEIVPTSSPCNPVTAHTKLTDPSSDKSFDDTENSRDTSDLVVTTSRHIPVVAIMSTDWCSPATSHIKLLDSETHNAAQVGSSKYSSEEAGSPEHPPPLGTPVGPSDPSKTCDVSSSGSGNSEGRVRRFESSTSAHVTSTSTSSSSRDLQESTGDPDVTPPAVTDVPSLILEVLNETNAEGPDGKRAEASPESADAAVGVEKQHVDNMALDVLRQLEKQPHKTRGPARRHTYEVSIPTGVWKLNFIPNGEVASLSSESAAEEDQSSFGSSKASSSSSRSSSSGEEAQRGCF